MAVNPAARLSSKATVRLWEHLGIAGEGDLTYLGRGSFASVYWLPDKRRVFKFTTDARDAQASANLLGKRGRFLVNVYDVFHIEKHWYGIINEKLTPMSASQTKQWEDLFEIAQNLRRPMSEQKTPVVPSIHKTFLTVAWVSAFRDAAYERLDPEYAVQYADEFLALLNMARELARSSIFWRDWHSHNYMLRGRDYVIVDLGGGTRSPQVKISSLL